MALILLGKTKCSLCGGVLSEGQEIVSFPPFVANRADPLCFFNDAAFHAMCFRSHPLAIKAEARFVELREKSSLGNRRCLVCRNRIENPDEYMGLPHLTDNPTAPAYEFNYAQFHRTCLKCWSGRKKVCQCLESLETSGQWVGPALEKILKEMRNLG